MKVFCDCVAFLSGCAILAEFGTLSLEFQYLSDMTGNKVFAEKVAKIENFLASTPKDQGLYYNYMHPITGKWCVKHATIGALADSFYEYLFKIWVYNRKQPNLETYLDAMAAIRHTMQVTTKSNLTYFGEYQNGKITQKMDYLGCFTGGLLAYTSATATGISEKAKLSTWRLLRA